MSLLAKYLLPVLLAVAGTVGVVAPKEAAASDIRVFVDLGDIVFSAGRPYHRHSHAPLYVVHERWGPRYYYHRPAPVYYPRRPAYYAPPRPVYYAPPPPPRHHYRDWRHERRDDRREWRDDRREWRDDRREWRDDRREWRDDRRDHRDDRRDDRRDRRRDRRD